MTTVKLFIPLGRHGAETSSYSQRQNPRSSTWISYVFLVDETCFLSLVAADQARAA